MRKFHSLLVLILLLANILNVNAQPTLQKDYSYVMEIPSVLTMDSSPAHVYVLSKTEGMAVFRTQHDTLQWLYTSTGMQQRGNTVTADIRFAYLFGDSRRLTVLEPTSVLGVYSSTLLPSNPRDAKRIDQNLYVAMGEKGLGKISLKTPATVDSTISLVERSRLSSERIIDLERSANQLFALAKNRKLYQFDYKDNKLNLTQEFDLSTSLNGIYLTKNSLFGSDASGSIYEIDGSGKLAELGNIDEPVNKIEAWKDWLVIRGSSNRLWTSYQNRKPELWKEDSKAGNYFTVTNDDLWLCEYNKISRIVPSGGTTSAQTGSQNSNQQSYSGPLKLAAIPNQTVPHTKPLLFPIELQGDVPANSVQFSYQSSDIKDAEIRGRSFYWKPTSDDVGSHKVKIIATATGGQTDSTTIRVEVRSFNAPPRFAPIRPITIPVGQEFSLPISATDPDGMNSDLIRFLGVDMPEGASIDEETGQFTWTPTVRQVGKNQFRVIATDQFGAANSADITITVVENVQRGNSQR